VPRVPQQLDPSIKSSKGLILQFILWGMQVRRTLISRLDDTQAAAVQRKRSQLSMVLRARTKKGRITYCIS
jgi:hypothetical protein